MTSQRTPDSDEARRTGHEPQLGGADGPRISGMEPLLGGIRRAGADPDRVEALLNAPGAAHQEPILDWVARFGQAALYAGLLAEIIPDRARHKAGSWRGTLTPSQRCRAIDALGVIGGYESIQPLLNVLGDPTYEVRIAAEAALGAVVARLPLDDRRTEAAFGLMVESLNVLPGHGRKVAARILSQAPPDLVLGPLLGAGLTAAEWWARREAAWTLGKLGDRRATKRLVNALDDPSAAVRGTSAWALGQLDAPVAIPALIRASNESDEVVRAAAVEALGAQVRRLTPDHRAFATGLARLVEALNDQDWAVRHAAYDSLSAITEPEARLALRSALKRKAE
ncbi:MAG: HEAT repeat domain-containing protein [Chloroflexota bacterium]